MRVYSLVNFKQHSQVEGGHKRSIRSCAWKPMGNVRGESVLATGSFDASAGIWRRWDESELVPRREGEEGEDDGPMERQVGNGDEEDESDWRFAVVLDGHESEIKSVAWSTSGQYLATCSRDKSVWVWEELDDDTFETVAVLQEHDGDVKCVVWHPEEELLASSSYDDTIRLYREDVDDWVCVALLRGHDSTVWAVDFEPVGPPPLAGSGSLGPAAAGHLEMLRRAGPRLISCSDDQTLRVWRRVPPPDAREQAAPTGQGRMPTILRTQSAEQEWIEEARLPQRHDRAVYSVAWSKRTGRVVSAGGDGRVVVYEERFLDSGSPHASDGSNGTETLDKMDAAAGAESLRMTQWVVVAEVEAAHGVFEVNHVCWAKRFDKGRRREDEEVAISTGDDGTARVWVFDT